VARNSFRQQILRVREDAIVASVNRLLAEKGFDLMTVDEVAADVGIAKASLYKHFASKEALAAAAMVRVLGLAWAFVQGLAEKPALTSIDKLKACAHWGLTLLIAGEMPSLPSQNSSLRAELLASKAYLDLLMQVSDQLGAWIVDAQERGQIKPELPPEVVLYAIFARACDPVPGFLKAGGRYSDEQIIDWVLACAFDGLATRAAVQAT
jgi:TetR/AcrR family transcriptional regulator, regulator of autoinduction and epiphytic fitness